MRFDELEVKEQFVHMYKEKKEARDRYDAALMVIRDCKSPYYTEESNELNKNKILSGEKDPFFDSFNDLYPEKGFEGFVEENPLLFINTSKKDLALASKRYKEVYYNFSPGILRIFTIPTIVATYFLLPKFAEFGHPVLFAVSIFITIMSIIHVPICRYYESFNLRVFYARKRICSDLGLTPEDIGKDIPNEQSE